MSINFTLGTPANTKRQNTSENRMTFNRNSTDNPIAICFTAALAKEL